MKEEQRKVLAHVVSDPDEWLAHVEKTFTPEKAKHALEAKVSRWKNDYESKKDDHDYKTRAERDADAESQK